MKRDHLAELIRRRPQLEACRADIESAFVLLEQAFRRSGKVLLCGNGGSAADAEHWAGELLKGFESRRPLPPQAREPLPPELANRLQGGLPAIPLTGFTSLRTAVANDIDAELEYAQLVWSLGSPSDVLVGISTSGQARNICRAAQAARARDMRVLALTGQAGGWLAELADCCIRVPESRTLLVQELHLPIYHCLSLMLEDAFFPAPGPDASAP
ncbi:MAG TPA: SIS domain-containing protein [Phycisphaeraceae bacterium]